MVQSSSSSSGYRLSFLKSKINYNQTLFPLNLLIKSIKMVEPISVSNDALDAEITKLLELCGDDVNIYPDKTV